MVLQAKLLLLACLIISTTLIQFSEAGKGGIVTYWGRRTNEGSLTKACNSGLYSYINIASLVRHGPGLDLALNLAGHCNPPNCTRFGEQIKTCQSQGIKLFISLFGNYYLQCKNDAKRVAKKIWNSYLGGTDSNAIRPFGDAVLDGVDFHIHRGHCQYYDDLARYLKELYHQQQNKTYYLSAAPQCPYPDCYLGKAINEGLFNFIWVQFYNNTLCQNSVGSGPYNLLFSWNHFWIHSNVSQLFLGLPASIHAANGGYMPPDELIIEVLPIIKSTTKYGGVMIWNRYYDVLSGYSSAIYPYIISENLLLPSMRNV